MTVYVDDVRLPFRNMVMCHMWADSLPELLAMASAIGLQHKWLQQPPKASWVHFDVTLSLKAKALVRGAVLTDRYGPSEHVARLEGNQSRLDTIARVRAMHEENAMPRFDTSTSSRSMRFVANAAPVTIHEARAQCEAVQQYADDLRSITNGLDPDAIARALAEVIRLRMNQAGDHSLNDYEAPVADPFAL